MLSVKGGIDVDELVVMLVEWVWWKDCFLFGLGLYCFLYFLF